MPWQTAASRPRNPQLLVPYTFLLRSHLSLDELGRPRILEFDTAGGPISMHVYPKACRVAVLEPDRESKEVLADLVISPVEKEVLMSDALIEELGIIILSPRSGLWRFSDERPSREDQAFISTRILLSKQIQSTLTNISSLLKENLMNYLP